MALWLLSVPGTALAYLTDAAIYPPLNYFIFLPPDAGGSYVDPTFGAVVKRISDSHGTPNAADTGNLPFITNEYSTMSPFNADNSRLLLIHHSYFALYDGQGNYLKDLPFEVNASSEPRWSRSDPNVFYYLRENQLKRYDVTTDAAATVRTFSEYGGVSGMGESDISFDGDHFVLVGDGRFVFVYTLSADAKGPALDTAGSAGFDQVYVTPDNNVLIGWYQSGTDRFQGVELYDQNMTFLRQVAPVLAHMDVARDVTGDEVLLWVNAADPNPPADCQNAVVKIRLSDGVRSCLISFDWMLAMHVSGADAGDWFVVSTYGPSDLRPLAGPSGHWAGYTNEILQVKLDGSEVRRLAHHRSRPFNDYYYSPRAASSRDGGKLVYSSNYGLPEILGYPSHYTDAYLIDLSAAGPSSAGSTNTVTRRFEQDAAAVSHSGSWFANNFPRHSGASAVLAMDAGDQLHFAFTGTTVSWIGSRDAWCGIARAYVDGALRAEVDTYAATAQAQAVLYTVSDLTPSAHTLTIESMRRRNPESGGAWVWVDAFDVALRLEQDTPAASYRGNWFTLSHSMLSGSSIALAMDAGNQVQFQFTGTEISWIGYRDAWSGIARVYVDGIFRAEIDTYAAVSNPQARVYTLSGLAPAAHSVTIEVTGRRNPASDGTWVWVDAFETPP